MKQILLIDNYDSFTHNLKHYLEALNAHVEVVRNDEFIGDYFSYDAIVLSPGPGLPENAGTMMQLLKEVEGRIPIFGICLGMQAIALHCGGKLYNQPIVKHGVQEKIDLHASELFKNLPKKIDVGLYHSWAVKEDAGNFKITAHSESLSVMAIESVAKKMYGVQFHPESVLSPDGMEIVKNFLELI
ncbi:MAG: aminodeoxychorismate/anthranilate synthase component II [Fluviicola sp.]|nr:aminodeoxychorismate/anthranilate synthase component II [Fluviicola sp.]